ncbi:hypothetical protein [Hymenobacter jeollabukensis]|uniref:Uncharacterized protein n=1 Tax=Hymenobacter jeollabukensis TaxID=2025313 RepID=A0A5R8WKL3_9BACT|nr:hypothetical protein [Hymenobacter jeollabukensis]TLM89364.1 hypothetical protein FDY95_20030 [Hymenobacter jeollabukensis]
MSTHHISYADLSGIENKFSRLRQELNEVASDVNHIGREQSQMKSQLEQLIDDFAEFVDTDRKQKALQLAETRVGVLSQQLQTEFGYYAEIRRLAVGMLQGVDVGVLSDDTLRASTEEVMIKAPGYWLAPVLVTLAAWIRQDQTTMQRALAEALRRDDYKTTLFLVLVMRRLGRREASLQWLQRYFRHQDPRHLDREFVTLLEGIATGLFPPAARQLMQDHLSQWLNQLTEGGGFVEKQRRKWDEFMEATAGMVGPAAAAYPLLSEHATNWAELNLGYNRTHVHELLRQHFNNITSGAHDFSTSLKTQLDETLSRLVSNFDDEELPLRHEVHLNQLIVRNEGDKAAAQAQLAARDGLFDQQVDLLQLLTNALFDSELAGTTRVTQALALSVSQSWILEAHGTFTGRARQQAPAQAQLALDGWQGQSADGHNETALLDSQSSHYATIMQTELAKVAAPVGRFVGAGVLAAFGVWAAFNGGGLAMLGAVCIILAGVLGYTGWTAFTKTKQQVRDAVNERHRRAHEVLRGCLAELVDFRRDYSRRDAQAADLQQLLAHITPESFSSKTYETSRALA